MIGIYIREAAMMTMTCGAGSDDTKRRAIVPIDFKLSSWRSQSSKINYQKQYYGKEHSHLYRWQKSTGHIEESINNAVGSVLTFGHNM